VSLLASAVTVVTTATADGPAGMTASAVCSLSLNPPQLLVCVQNALPTHQALAGSRWFAVNVLGEEQAGIARRFATPGIDRFHGLALREDSPAPVLRQALAYFVCAAGGRHPGGDHSIFTGLVVSCGHQPGQRPLLHFGRGFRSLADPQDQLLRAWAEAGMLA